MLLGPDLLSYKPSPLGLMCDVLSPLLCKIYLAQELKLYVLKLKCCLELGA